MYLHYFEYMVY